MENKPKRNLKQKNHFSNTAPFFLCFIVLVIVVLIRQAIKGQFLYDIDVARDFLLMEQVISSKHLILIGARTAIQGVFHGPFWLYTQLPIFFLSKGNPIIQNWFWSILFIGFLGEIYLIGKRLFDPRIALAATTLISTQGTPYFKSPTNPIGALLLFPLFFFTYTIFLRKQKPFFLAVAFFLLGCIIQSEIVFGLPIACLTCIHFLLFQKKKNIRNYLSLFAIFPSLSTYFLFEIKHGFLQTKSFITFLTQQNNNQIQIIPHLFERVKGFLSYGVQIVSYFPAGDQQSSPLYFWGNLVIFSATIFLFLIAKNRLKEESYTESCFFLFLYIGFWCCMLFTNQKIHWYYYLPFLPLMTLFVTYVVVSSLKNIGYLLLFLPLFFNVIQLYNLQVALNTNATSWQFHSSLARQIIAKSRKTASGYFINTFDQISSYLPLYAMMYETNQQSLTHMIIPFEKKENTFFIIGPYPDGTPLDNTWWKNKKIKISKKPVSSILFHNGFTLEQYHLDKTDLKNKEDVDVLQYSQYR